MLALLFAVGIRTVSGQVQNRTSALHNVTSLIGTGISGSFLYLIAALNLIVLFRILRVQRRMRRGAFDEAQLERQLDRRGAMTRIYGRFTRTVTRSWHMYPLGMLFGLGFDTATEVALLFLAAGAAGAGLPFYAILCLPILFAAGMALLDTIDGSFMNFAYGWAFSNPVRKIYYNITITGLSVAVALIVGTVELMGLAVDRLGLRGVFWDWISGIDINAVGYLIVGPVRRHLGDRMADLARRAHRGALERVVAWRCRKSTADAKEVLDIAWRLCLRFQACLWNPLKAPTTGRNGSHGGSGGGCWTTR